MELPKFERCLHAGGNSLLVALPKSWIRANQLNKGDRVLIQLEKDGGLLVTCKSL